MDAEKDKLYGEMLLFAHDVITAMEVNQVKPRPGKMCVVMVMAASTDETGKPVNQPVGGSVNWHEDEGQWQLHSEASEGVPLSKDEIKELEKSKRY